MKMLYTYLLVLVPGEAVLLLLLEREIAKQVSFVDAGATVSDNPIRQTRGGAAGYREGPRELRGNCGHGEKDRTAGGRTRERSEMHGGWEKKDNNSGIRR